ncbi:MAG: ABC transporter ATP-binding protein [Verrucomicrobia bacterium]|nr:MAG: ABC transporter ATP-binding protein [Verrucomicrobiota bacterium]
MLKVNDLDVFYGSIQALHGVSFEVPAGKIVTLVGANGAGKSTILRTISGLNRPTKGSIQFNGKEISGLAPHLIVEQGLAQVPEGRMIFPDLSVAENLKMGAYRRKNRSSLASDQEYIFSIFPRIAERLNQQAGTLSGGEQQMLAIGRAIMSGAEMLMLDEPSLGIAPILVETIFERIVELNENRGFTILLVEQNANLALQVSHLGCVLESGRVTVSGRSEDLQENPQVRKAYLGH